MVVDVVGATAAAAVAVVTCDDGATEQWTVGTRAGEDDVEEDEREVAVNWAAAVAAAPTWSGCCC